MKEIQSWIDHVLQNRTLTHILYWVGILAFYPLYARIFNALIYDSFVIKLFYLPGQILASYLLIYFQIPRLIYAKRYFSFFISFVLSFYGFSILAHVVNDYGIAVVLGEHHPKHTLIEMVEDPYDFYYIFAAYLIPIITAGIKVVKQNFEEKKQFEQLQKEKAQAELNLLKAQLHPRFLFNTLDHLYELTLQESDAAPEVVVKLSEMLDYMLYEGNAQRVLITKEVELIQHYIDLEVLRYGGKLEWDFVAEITDSAAKAAPLLLLSVVEQAFKYGVKEEMIQPKIRILLKVTTDQLDLEIFTNQSWISTPVESQHQNDYTPSNIQRQLALTYPERHQLIQKIQDEVCRTRLTLNL